MDRVEAAKRSTRLAKPLPNNKRQARKPRQQQHPHRRIPPNRSARQAIDKRGKNLNRDPSLNLGWAKNLTCQLFPSPFDIHATCIRRNDWQPIGHWHFRSKLADNVHHTSPHATKPARARTQKHSTVGWSSRVEPAKPRETFVIKQGMGCKRVRRAFVAIVTLAFGNGFVKLQNKNQKKRFSEATDAQGLFETWPTTSMALLT